MYKVIAYITAYNDIQALNHCLAQLNQQTYLLDAIYIVDNSEVSILKYIQRSDHIIYHHYPNNIGVAGGLNQVITWSLNQQYDFLWTLDQDSAPSLDALKILLDEYQFLKQHKIEAGIIAPTIIDVKTKKILPNGYLKRYKFDWKLAEHSYFVHKNLYQCDVVITSGSLVNLQVAQTISLPNPALFIDGVDWEYCLNFKNRGYPVFVTQKTTMQHHFGTYLTNITTQYPIYIYSPLRYYYINRNHTYIETRLSNNPLIIILSVLHRIKILIKKMIKIVVYEPDEKPLKLWASCLGFIHGIIGKLGKI